MLSRSVPLGKQRNFARQQSGFLFFRVPLNEKSAQWITEQARLSVAIFWARGPHPRQSKFLFRTCVYRNLCPRSFPASLRPGPEVKFLFLFINSVTITASGVGIVNRMVLANTSLGSGGAFVGPPKNQYNLRMCERCQAKRHSCFPVSDFSHLFSTANTS